ncbi:MAG: Flp pilus assembly complex ATPase component TadA [Chitinispirillales bacterium]|jgi:type IV pilus assembly protein PilB|nr:Flp pilus assembly complex ATPase component TadA [Chitinispirillales bacterium]
MQRRGKKLGEILLSMGLITEEQLENAFRTQAITGQTLAAILVSSGAISTEDLSSVLGEQVQVDSKKRIGDILIEQGVITPEHLAEALKQQKVTGKKIGETLIAMGILTESKLIDILGAQLDVQHVILDGVKINPQLTALITEEMCKRYKIIPIYEQNDMITIAMTDPTDLRTIDHIKFVTGKNIDVVMTSEKQILSAITRVYEDKQKQLHDILQRVEGENATLEIISDEEEKELLSDEEGAQVVNIVNMIIHEAIEKDASDIHLEPTSNGYRVRYRIDGDLQTIQELPATIRPQVISRLKIQGGMDIAEKRKPQDGRIRIKHQARMVDLRVSSFPSLTRQVQSEKIVLRIIDAEGKQFTLPQLGFGQAMYDKFEELIQIPDGIILVTGPTGSGKSSTLYAALEFINRHYEYKKNIITMEDPVESNVEGITQGQINVKAGFTFASGMRSILRQDPDIIMVGEMRDVETGEMAVQAALTGHVVFSTLHTNDSASAFTRLLDMGVQSYLVSSTVRGVLAQRLVRRVCSACKEEFEPEPEVLYKVGLKAGVKLYRGKGCRRCNNTGYKGRMGIFELLIPDRQVQKMIIGKAESDEIKDYMVKRGDFSTLRRDGLIKVLKGETTLEQVLGATQENT